MIAEGKPEKFGLLDRNGNTVIPCIYDWIYPALSGENILVKKGKRWGLINLKNEPVTRFIYDTIKIEDEQEPELYMQGM